MGSNPTIHFIFWKEEIFKKSILKYKIIHNGFYFDKNLIKFNKNLELEENKKKIEINNLANLTNFSNNEKFLKELEKNDWSSYKKKLVQNIIIKKKKEVKKPFSIFSGNFKSLNIFKEIIGKFYENNFSNPIKSKNKVLDLYKKINIKKIKSIKNNLNFESFEKKSIIILDLRGLKNKLIFINKNNCKLSITPGIIFKKMQMKDKKSKKSNKMLILMLKYFFKILNRKYFFKEVILNIKGLKTNFNKIISIVLRNMINKKVLIIHSIKNNTTGFKFKKLKSIKRRLKKKIIKLK